jgi:3-phenylpropionate/cinnamic acid dioxygenase small subunit
VRNVSATAAHRRLRQLKENRQYDLFRDRPINYITGKNRKLLKERINMLMKKKTTTTRKPKL